MEINYKPNKNKNKMEKNKKCLGFVLIKEYPNSPKLGAFEKLTTGEFFKYPEVWKPIYDNDNVVTKTHVITITVNKK